MGVDYHAWTHRPKAQGGTDPIDISSGLPSAMLLEGQSSRASGTQLSMTYGSFYRNDPMFGYSDVTSAKAKYMTLSEPGLYMGDFTFTWDTDFTVGDNPFIEPSAEQGGFPGPLVGGPSIYWEGTYSWIGAEQLTAAEHDHHMIQTRVYWVFTAADWGETPMKIGCDLFVFTTRTKNFGSDIVITRLGDALTEVTIT